jgi:phosphoglucomutase
MFGSVWTSDKDGIIACLLSAEITARLGRDPGEVYHHVQREFGLSHRNLLLFNTEQPIVGDFLGKDFSEALTH